MPPGLTQTLRGFYFGDQANRGGSHGCPSSSTQPVGELGLGIQCSCGRFCAGAAFCAVAGIVGLSDTIRATGWLCTVSSTSSPLDAHLINSDSLFLASTIETNFIFSLTLFAPHALWRRVYNLAKEAVSTRLMQFFRGYLHRVKLPHLKFKMGCG